MREKKILLVEDEPGLVLTLTDRLESEGYAVDSAREGGEALKKAAEGPYDLILLDVMLPGKSGFDVAVSSEAADRRLRSSSSRLAARSRTRSSGSSSVATTTSPSPST